MPPPGTPPVVPSGELSAVLVGHGGTAGRVGTGVPPGAGSEVLSSLWRVHACASSPTTATTRTRTSRIRRDRPAGARRGRVAVPCGWL